MSADTMIKNSLENAMRDKNGKEDKANAVIWAGTMINAGLGVAPFGVNIVTFMGVSSLMVTVVGSIYGYTTSKEEAAKFIRQVIGSAGLTFGVGFLAIKVLTELGKPLTGPFAMGLDAAMMGAATYALGYTAKDYFERGKGLSTEQLSRKFKTAFNEGKNKVRQAS